MNYIKTLEPGAKVSVRELSAQLSVSEGTAYKAVKDAEQRGLVMIKPKAGTVRVGAQPEGLEKQITALEAARLLGLTALAGKAFLDQTIQRLIICDGSEQSLLRQLSGQAPRGCLCLCGDRAEMQAAVLEQGANLLLTGGAKADALLSKTAEAHGQYILGSSHGCYVLVRLFEAECSGRAGLSEREPVGNWMQTPDYLYYNDITADWQRLYAESSMTKEYPIVDDDLEIYGGLELWRAFAAVPSQKLSSLMAERPGFPQVSIQDDMRDVARKFITNGDELAAVLDGKRMVGILTAADLLRCYMFSGPASSVFNADLFLTRDQTVLDRNVMVYSVRIPEARLKDSRHIGMALLLSAAGNHLRRLGAVEYQIESGTFLNSEPVTASEGLILTSRVLRETGDTYTIETEINDDAMTYAKAVLVVSETAERRGNDV